MSFVVADVLGILVALPLLALIVMAPGRLFAALFDFPRFAETRDPLFRAGVSLIVGGACMPVVLDLAGRAGPKAMLGAALALSALGIAAAVQSRLARDSRAAAPPIGTFPLVALAVWIPFAILFLVDWPEGAGLHRSMQSADHVKHAAATWAIAQSGTPPFNPTFFEPGAKAAYYYFFYNLTATAELMGAPFGIAGRHAAWAGIILAGPLLVALAAVVYARSGAARQGGATSNRPLAPWLVTLILTTGLDILPVVLIGGLIYHAWITNYEFWDTQVTSWLNSVLWVPHHVFGLAAAWTGFLALADFPLDRKAAARRVALAGFAFASCAGMSIYVAMGAAPIAVVFMGLLARERRFPELAAWGLAGALAGALAAPWLLALLAGRPMGPGDAPIAFEIRALPVLDAVVAPGAGRALLRLIAAPFAYGVEFGVYLVGAVTFWRHAGRRGLEGDVAQLLAIGVGVSLLIGTFLRSSVLNNDLGWRVLLFAQLATLVWTLAAVHGGLFSHAVDARARLALAFQVCLALGFAADAYGLVQTRRYPEETSVEIAIAPDERAAWEWLRARLPAGAVVQENPNFHRAFGYGLYGEFREAVSDQFNGLLFGSTRAAVEQRIAELSPLFNNLDLDGDEAMRIATRAGIDVMVFRAIDPVFKAQDSWIWRTPALHANDSMRLIATVKRSFAELRP